MPQCVSWGHYGLEGLPLEDIMTERTREGGREGERNREREAEARESERERETLVRERERERQRIL
jgi:hypothetical protein